MYEQYLTLSILGVLAIVLGATILVLNKLLGPQKWTKSKLDTFETGNEPEGDARQRFSVRFYLVAILFILFDIETVFLYLWASAFDMLGWFGVVEVAIFVTTLAAGYVYILKRGALDWD